MREETKASSTVGSRREYPRGVLAGRDDVMLVRPLFSCSQGHAIWDGELIIIWDLAGYCGEAFGTESSWVSQTTTFLSSLCLATQDALWAFNIATKPAVLSMELFVGRHLHIKVLRLSSHNSFFFFFFSIILCQLCQDKIKIRRSDGTWEQKYSFSAVHAI